MSGRSDEAAEEEEEERKLPPVEKEKEFWDEVYRKRQKKMFKDESEKGDSIKVW